MLSARDRQQLFEVLRGLPQAQFEELLFSLNVTAGVVPGGQAAQGNRVAALLEWAEAPTGCGLQQVREVSVTYVPELENTFADPASETYWLVPYARNPFFAGRDFLLQRLRETLTQGSAAAISQVQAISGLGGIGKTQTAVEYAYRYRDDYDAVFWVQADTVLELSSGFVEIAQLLNLPQKDAENQDEVVQAVKLWLSRNDNWLLIFDNADQPDLVQPFQPTAPKGHVLITSRAQDLQALGIAGPVKMETLEPDEALAFLLQRTDMEAIDKNDPVAQAAAKLAEELGYLPLALEQAAAYIVTKTARFQDYLASYQKLKLKRLEKSKPMLGSYSDSVATTWNLNFEQVETTEPAAADLLRVSAVLHPDAIPFELLTQGGSQLGDALAEALEDAVEDPLTVNELLEPLYTYSLIRVDRVNQSYSIHRLVQDVVRADMATDETLSLWIDRTVSAANQLLPDKDETGLEYQDSYKTWPVLGRLTKHVQALMQADQASDCRSLTAASLFYSTGDYLLERGQHALAEPLLQKAFTLRQQLLGQEHLKIAESLDRLARWYELQGRYSEAEPLYLQALALNKRLLGDEHLAVANSLNELALLYANQGRYSEAEPLYLQALALNRRLLDDEHLAVAQNLNNLAALYYNEGRYSEAEPLYLQALELRKRLLGDEHPSVANSLNNLGLLYENQGRYSEAEPLYRQALELRTQLLGDEHPDVVSSLNNLSVLYDNQGRYSEAEPLHLQALALNKRLLGDEHPSVAISLSNLASSYRDQERYSEAEPMTQQALSIFVNLLGEDHPNVGRVTENLGTLYKLQGRKAEAERLYRQALEILEPKLGAEHPWTVRCRENLAALDSEEVEGLRVKSKE